MASKALARHSLKTRITLGTLAIFLTGLWSLSFYASQMLHGDIKRLLGKQQFSTVSMVAAEINDDLDKRMKALQSVAVLSLPALRAGAPQLQALLEQQTVLQTLFNGGVIGYRLDGTAIADVPLPAQRIGINYLDIDTIAAALRQGRSTIGRPVMGKQLKAPVFGMAVPIHDEQGQVIGALAGVINLGTVNFLDRITHGRYGQTGGYVLNAPQHGLVVTSSNKSRIMAALPAPGVNPMLDRYRQGYEGTDIFIDPRGVEVLASVKGIAVAGWYVAVTLPTAEAFAPIRAMQQRMLLATLVLTLLAAGLTWWLLRRQLAPLLATATTLAGLADSQQPAQPLAISRPDEIGQLIGGFNRLLMALGQRETLLQQIMDTSSVAIFLIDQDGRIAQANRRMADMFGCTPQALQGCQYLMLVHPSDRQQAQQNTQALLASALPSVDLDQLFLRADHSQFWGHLTCHGFQAPGKAARALVCVVADVSARHAAEAAHQASEQRFRDMVNSADGIVWEADATSQTFTFVSEKAERLLGFALADWLQPGFWAAQLHPQDQSWVPGFCASQSAQLKDHDFEYRFIARDGRTVWLRDIVTVVAEQGRPRWLRGIMIDISQRKQDEASLRVAATAFESQEAMIVTDAKQIILKVNQAFTRMTGYSEAEVIGQTPALLRSGRQDATFYQAMWQSIQRHHYWQGEIWNRRKSGEIYPERLAISAVLDETGCVSHYVGAFSDLTEQRKAQDQIEQLAFTDALTNLPNRRLLLERLKHALATSVRRQHQGALLFIDLDNFKTLNDTLGHDLGDQLLQQVAQRLLACVRANDTVARLGGDEFVVLLENLSQHPPEAAVQAQAVAEKMLAALNQLYLLASHAHHSSASIGLTLFGQQGESVDQLLKQADLALYSAKTAGRNALRFFDPHMQAVIIRRAALEADLREALVQDQFFLHYQVQVVDDQATGKRHLSGAEVLVRWHHPERGMVSPAEFIAVAEETGLILPLGHWVLKTACTQLTAWSAKPEMAGLTLAVNVSPGQFHHPDFVAQVLAVLEHSGADPRRLKLELTEGMLIANVEDVIVKMNALKACGVGFSLDDFGTGYSSLAYLKRLPLDQLKIDQGFVRDILVDPNDAAIARTVVALAASLGLAVIAEGVETQAQRAVLADLGCLAYQGYLFGRPLPLQEFEELMQQI